MSLRGSIFFFFSVKFSIKSFKVPELYIEIPETATVGSLKVYCSICVCEPFSTLMNYNKTQINIVDTHKLLNLMVLT